MFFFTYEFFLSDDVIYVLKGYFCQRIFIFQASNASCTFCVQKIRKTFQIFVHTISNRVIYEIV